MQGNGRAGQAGDQGMTLTGGNTEPPGCHRPSHNGKQGRAQSHQRLAGIPSEIHHTVNGGGNAGIDHGHHQHTQKIEHCCHQNGRPGGQGLCGNTGCNRVRRVCPAVDQDHTQSQEYRDRQYWVADQLGQKFCQRYHLFSLSLHSFYICVTFIIKDHASYFHRFLSFYTTFTFLSIPNLLFPFPAPKHPHLATAAHLPAASRFFHLLSSLAMP